MTDIDRAGCTIGAIVLGISEYVDFIRINREPSVIASDIIVIKAFKVVNKVTYSLSEAISMTTLTEINDPTVIADALIEKMKRQVGEKRGG